MLRRDDVVVGEMVIGGGGDGVNIASGCFDGESRLALRSTT